VHEKVELMFVLRKSGGKGVPDSPIGLGSDQPTRNSVFRQNEAFQKELPRKKPQHRRIPTLVTKQKVCRNPYLRHSQRPEIASRLGPNMRFAGRQKADGMSQLQPKRVLLQFLKKAGKDNGIRLRFASKLKYHSERSPRRQT
jgi:hypothetical protein